VKKDLAEAKKHYEKALADAGYVERPAKEEEKKEIQQRLAKVNAAIAEEERQAEAKRQEEARAARIAARTQVFVSYAHRDMAEVDYVDELRPHLRTLNRTRGIEWWYDKELKPGEKWDEKIKEALAKAKVAVLLVSANFFDLIMYGGTSCAQYWRRRRTRARQFCGSLSAPAIMRTRM